MVVFWRPLAAAEEVSLGVLSMKSGFLFSYMVVSWLHKFAIGPDHCFMANGVLGQMGDGG